MKITAKIYIPKPWDSMNRALRKRFRQVEDDLRQALALAQPTYDQLAGFTLKPTVHIRVRKTVAVAVAKRSKRSHSMSHEIACFRKIMNQDALLVGQTIYQSASNIRQHLFNRAEPLRKYNMTISYHAKWMSIAPPSAGDPVFFDLDAFSKGGGLFGALNIYLILLTSHPYSDGNGRTSRIMFSLYLAKAFGTKTSYVPLAELTRSTSGIYEEFIAEACRHGDFSQLIWFLLTLLNAYANFLRTALPARQESDLSRILKLVADDRIEGINNIPPFPISFQTLLRNETEIDIHRNFFTTIQLIADELEVYGKIQFALTGLADLTPEVSPESGTIVFFIDSSRKEDLLLHFRELRAKYYRRTRLQVVVASGNPVIDAKILFILMSRYVSQKPLEKSCPVLLHDFALQNGGDETTRR